MRKRIAILALLAVALMAPSSEYKASQVKFTDGETVQEKFDAGDLGGTAAFDSADCSAETGYTEHTLCRETGDDTLWQCDAATCNGANWVQITGGGATTNLSVGSKTSTTFDVESSTGLNATLPAATDTEAGLQTAAQKSKLDDIPVEFDAIIDISDRTTACQNWATVVEDFMDGTITSDSYHVAVVGTPSSPIRIGVDTYDNSGAWPYDVCFPLHPQDGTSPDSPWPDSLDATAATPTTWFRKANDGVMTLYMLHGEIRVDQSAMDKNAALFDFGNGYMAGRNGNIPYGNLGGRIRVAGESRVVNATENESGYTGGGTVGEHIPEGDSSSRFNRWSTTTFVPFAAHGADYIDASKWTTDWFVDDDDIGMHITESWGSSWKIDAMNGGEGVGLQLFGVINADIRVLHLREQDYGVVYGGGFLDPSGADDIVHYYTSCASASCAGLERGVRGARIRGGMIEGHSQALVVGIQDEMRSDLEAYFECGSTSCAIGGILYRPKLCDGTGTTPVAVGKPLASDAAEATSCAASGGNANTPDEAAGIWTKFSLNGQPTPGTVVDDVPNIWFGQAFTDRFVFVIEDGSVIGTMTSGSAGDDSYAPFKASGDLTCGSGNGCGLVYLGATNQTFQDHDDAPAGAPHVDYGGLIRVHPLGSLFANTPIEIRTGASVPGSCEGSEIFLLNTGTSGQRFYACEGGVFVLQGDGGGAGAGDSVSIDGVAATDPDFTSDGDLTVIRCTGAGAPDAACVSAEDVIYRYKTDSVALGTDTTGGYAASATEGGAATSIADDTVTDPKMGADDFGDFSCAGTAESCTLDAGVVDKAAHGADSVGDDELDYSELADLSLGGQVADDSHSHVIANIDTFSSADLRGRLTDEEGTGDAVFEGGNPSFASVTIDPSATPGIDLKDSNATAGDVNASWEAGCTDVGDGTEDCDTWLESQTAGTTTTRVYADADGPVHIEGANAYIGPNDTPATPATATGEGDLFVEDALEVDGATDLDSSLDVAGTATLEGLLDIGTVETFGNPDTTPDVSTGIYWTTNATNNTITDFDGTPINGQTLVVLESDGGTVLDCTASGLKCGTADITMAADDVASFVYDGTDWILTSYVDQADDLGADAGAGGGISSLGGQTGSTQTFSSTNASINITSGTDDHDIEVDVAPSSGSATLEVAEDAVQVKYDGTLTEGASGLGVAAGGVDTTQLADDAVTMAKIDSTLDFLITGTIRGQVHIVTTTGTTDSPSADEMRGTFHVSNNASGTDYTLPTAVAGMSACFYDLNGGGVVTLDANTGDVIYLDGTALDAGDAIDSAGALGDFICILAIDATNWVTLGRSGTWIDGGVD